MKRASSRTGRRPAISRFNLALSGQDGDYLQEVADLDGRSRTDVLREAIAMHRRMRRWTQKGYSVFACKDARPQVLLLES